MEVYSLTNYYIRTRTLQNINNYHKKNYNSMTFGENFTIVFCLFVCFLIVSIDCCACSLDLVFISWKVGFLFIAFLDFIKDQKGESNEHAK